MEGVRVNKAVADTGYCSRRQADALVSEGRVTIDGKVAVPGDRVSKGQALAVDGERLTEEGESILLIFNKPVGVTCTTDEDDATNVIDFIGYPKRIFPVGRLDKDSEGLLLLTNRGELVNGLMRSRYGHEKEYDVRVDRPLTKRFMDGMRAGVPILDTVTKPCALERTGSKRFTIVITEGMNLQIRRMCAHFGYGVVSLKRVRIHDIVLGDLKPGEYRKATRDEKRRLFALTVNEA
ncbi:MAG: pseudouridine synthase [Thermoplasmatales archaeon]|nr:pseudouridine synthase [Thermoplasmatales archaeon]